MYIIEEANTFSDQYITNILVLLPVPITLSQSYSVYFSVVGEACMSGQISLCTISLQGQMSPACVCSYRNFW